MNANTKLRLAAARKSLKLGGHNRSITFSVREEDVRYGQKERPAKVFTPTGISGTPEKYRCSKHRSVELKYGTPCPSTH